MTNNATRREIVAGLNEFADTIQKFATTYEAISGLPSVQLLRQAKQAANLAPKLDASSPAFAPFRHAEPTTWSPPWDTNSDT